MKQSDSRLILWAGLLVGMNLLHGAAVAQDAVPWTENEELAAYLNESAENHPSLKALHADWLAAMEMIPQATALEDPMFSFGGFLASTSNRFNFKLSQKFPWFGTRHLRGESAGAGAATVLAQLAAERDMLWLQVKEIYIRFAYLAEEDRIIRTQQAVISFIEETVRTRYALGLATQDDLLRIQLEQEQVRNTHESHTAQGEQLNAEMIEALGRATYDALPWPHSILLPPEIPPVEALLAACLDANPRLAVWDRQLEQLEKETALARKKGMPNFTLGLDYTTISTPRQTRPDRPYPASLNGARRLIDMASGRMPFDPISAALDGYSVGTSREPMAYGSGGEDNLMVSVSVNVPLFRKKVRAGIDEARYREEGAKHRRTALERSLAKEVRVQHSAFIDAIRGIRLYRDSLVEKAQQSFENLESGYAAGDFEVSFIDVLDSIQTLLKLEREQAAIKRDGMFALARLEWLAGGFDTAPQQEALVPDGVEAEAAD